jgi:hypothetical protein
VTFSKSPNSLWFKPKLSTSAPPYTQLRTHLGTGWEERVFPVTQSGRSLATQDTLVLLQARIGTNEALQRIVNAGERWKKVSCSPGPSPLHAPKLLKFCVYSHALPHPDFDPLFFMLRNPLLIQHCPRQLWPNGLSASRAEHSLLPKLHSASWQNPTSLTHIPL